MINTKRIIWTATAHELLYEQLVEQFGPHSTWEHKHNPGHGKEKEYRKFLEAFAIVVGANSEHAVRVQIGWAFPIVANGTTRATGPGSDGKTPKKPIWPMQNMVAAYDAGFIDDSYIPALAR